MKILLQILSLQFSDFLHYQLVNLQVLDLGVLFTFYKIDKILGAAVECIFLQFQVVNMDLIILKHQFNKSQ